MRGNLTPASARVRIVAATRQCFTEEVGKSGSARAQTLKPQPPFHKKHTIVSSRHRVQILDLPILNNSDVDSEEICEKNRNRVPFRFNDHVKAQLLHDIESVGGF